MERENRHAWRKTDLKTKINLRYTYIYRD